MSILTAASSKSVFKGYDYYTRKKVLSACQLDESRWAGQVSGSNGETYDVTIDIGTPARAGAAAPLPTGGRWSASIWSPSFSLPFPTRRKIPAGVGGADSA